MGTAIYEYNRDIILSQMCREKFEIQNNHIYFRKFSSLESFTFVRFFYSGGDVTIVSYHKPPAGVTIMNYRKLFFNTIISHFKTNNKD